MKHTCTIVFAGVCLSFSQAWSNPSAELLWEERGDLVAPPFESTGRGFASGSSLTVISDPTGSGRGSVMEVNLGGASAGTEFASIEVEESPFKTAGKVVYSGNIQPGTSSLTLSVDLYIPSTGTLGAGDGISFLIRTENDNFWWTNNGGEWDAAVNLSPGVNLGLTDQWQTLSTTINVPASAGGGASLNGLFPLVTLNDAAPGAANGVFAYVDNIVLTVENPGVHAGTPIQVNAGIHRFVGRSREFDRSRFFNIHGDSYVPPTERALLSDPNEIYTFPARFANAIDQIASRIWWPPPAPADPKIPEDPSNPGFPDLVELDGSIDSYESGFTMGQRFEPLVDYEATAEDTFITISGRNIGGRYPDYLLTEPGTGRLTTDIPLNYPGFATFINRVLDNTNRLFPTNRERIIFEIMNEPNFTSAPNYNDQDIVNLHAQIPPLVRPSHPDMLIGGPSFGGTGFRDFSSWELFKSVMDGAGSQLDFFSFHPYDRYDLSASALSRGVITSAGRVSANMDLIENYSANNLGGAKPHAITEYGDWILTNSPNYTLYPREQRMWDQVVAILEKMMVFMDRPDRLLTAIPFINTFSGGSPSADSAFSTNLFAQEADGTVIETTVAMLYRLLHDVTGDYVAVDSGSLDIQAQAFRDGNTLYILLNNLETSAQLISVDVIAGQFGTVDSVIRRRLRYISNVANYDSGTAIPSVDLPCLTLDPQEKSLLIVSLGGTQTYDAAVNERIFYGTNTVQEILASGNVTTSLTLDLAQAVSAKLRFGFFRPSDSVVPDLTATINSNPINLPGGSLLAYDDTDARSTSREIDVPLSMLNDGANTVTISFPNSGGHLMSVVAVVQETLGDFNGNQVFDYDDRIALEAAIGNSVSPTNDHYDLNNDGNIDANDVIFFDDMRGSIMVTPFRLSTGPSGVDEVLLTWTSRTGATYRIEASSSLLEGDWTEIASEVSSGGTTSTFIDTSAFTTMDQAFYRISED